MGRVFCCVNVMTDFFSFFFVLPLSLVLGICVNSVLSFKILIG